MIELRNDVEIHLMKLRNRWSKVVESNAGLLGSRKLRTTDQNLVGDSHRYHAVNHEYNMEKMCSQRGTRLRIGNSVGAEAQQPSARGSPPMISYLKREMNDEPQAKWKLKECT